MPLMSCCHVPDSTRPYLTTVKIIGGTQFFNFSFIYRLCESDDILQLIEEIHQYSASDEYAAKQVGCRVSVGSYVLCQVQGVDSCSCYSFKAV